MKKAFTLIELIFVIIVIGIIATVAMPNLNKNDLPKAAIQVAGHIRYTQHLAMVDDKFDSNTTIVAAANSGNWFNKRWRIVFSDAATAGGTWTYTIYDDRDDNATGQATSPEVAVNPLNTSKVLSGGAVGADLNSGDLDLTEELNIGNEYGILDVVFSASCRTSPASRTLTFDYLGRPLRGALSDYTSAYDSGVLVNLLVSTQCVIDLCTLNPCPAVTSNDKISIAIEPETGYVHILP